MNGKGRYGTALEELIVLDFSRDIAGPLVGQMLGDLGANVIKIERPGYGDESREWGPPLAGDDHYSAYFVAFNRNKRSLSLDLGHPMGREIALDLLRRADVLVENFRGDTAKRLRLSPTIRRNQTHGWCI